MDQLCLTEDKETCVPDFKMLSVVQTVDLAGLKCDGILGLSPSAQRQKSGLFMDELKERGIIDERIFTLALNGEADNGHMATFGGYDLSLNKTGG